MAEIVGIDGVPIEHKSRATPVESCLEDLLGKIEDGLSVENIFVIAVTTDPADPTRVKYMTFDSGMRVAETVFLLESMKHDLIRRTYDEKL